MKMALKISGGIFTAIIAGLALYLHSQKHEGVFWGYAVEGNDFSTNSWNELNSQMPLEAQIIEFYIQWPPPSKSDAVIPTATLKTIWEHGAIACITWEPMYLQDGIEHTVTWEDIRSGLYESYLQQLSDHIKALPFPIVIRFGHEMNLQRYHWASHEDSYNEDSPALYKQMYRHLIDFFRNRQVLNVLWAFCPNADSIPNNAWNKIENYYPGSDYIDILGMDGYNWGSTQTAAKNGWNSHWRSFSDIFSSVYHDLKKLDSSKPIFVFETASVRQGGDRKKWLKEAWSTCLDWNITALIWFQVQKEEDWTLTPSEIDIGKPRKNIQRWAQNNLKS